MKEEIVVINSTRKGFIGELSGTFIFFAVMIFLLLGVVKVGYWQMGKWYVYSYTPVCGSYDKDKRCSPLKEYVRGEDLDYYKREVRCGRYSCIEHKNESYKRVNSISEYWNVDRHSSEEAIGMTFLAFLFALFSFFVIFLAWDILNILFFKPRTVTPIDKKNGMIQEEWFLLPKRHGFQCWNFSQIKHPKVIQGTFGAMNGTGDIVLRLVNNVRNEYEEINWTIPGIPDPKKSLERILEGLTRDNSISVVLKDGSDEEKPD